MKVFLDGEILDGARACVPVTDHGLLYGDGVFEGIRVHGGFAFRLDAHLARLAASARAIGLEIPGGVEGARTAVLAAARAFARPDAYLRLIVTRGDGALGVDPTTCTRPRLLCIADAVRIYPPEKLARGLDLITASVRRPPSDVLDPRVKSLNYLNPALAKREARLRGADEALVLNTAGAVAEASVANAFAVRVGVLLTPLVTDGALEGITRATVLEIARDLGLEAHERTLGRADFFAADEAFLTGTGISGVVPVRSLDGASIGSPPPGPITQKLRAAYEERLRSEGFPI